MLSGVAQSGRACLIKVMPSRKVPRSFENDDSSWYAGPAQSAAACSSLTHTDLEESTKYRRHAAQTGGLEQMEPQRRPTVGTSANTHVQLLSTRVQASVLHGPSVEKQRDISMCCLQKI